MVVSEALLEGSLSFIGLYTWNLGFNANKFICVSVSHFSVLQMMT